MITHLATSHRSLEPHSVGHRAGGGQRQPLSSSVGMRFSGVHVGINAHLLSSAASYRSAGVSNYSRHLLTALGRLVVERAIPHRFSAFLHAADFSAAGIEVQWGSERLEEPLLRIAWEQSVLPVSL